MYLHIFNKRLFDQSDGVTDDKKNKDQEKMYGFYCCYN